MLSGPWRVPGLKVTEYHAIILTPKEIVYGVGLFIFCSWGGSRTVAGAMEEVKY